MSTGEEEIRPWEYPPITLKPVTIHEVFELIDQGREASKNRTDLSERPVHSLPIKEMMELPHGTGYYKRALAEGEKDTLDEMVHSWLLYFGMQVGNFQVLSIIDLPEYRATFVRARRDENSRWGEWYMYTSGYPIPMDRSVLVTEIFSHA